MKETQGFTLVELLLSMTVGSVLMALALGMVHRAMRVESTAHTHAGVERTATRLSRQFRHDIHQAESVFIGDQPAGASSLRLMVPDKNPITYQVEKSRVRREQPLGDEQIHREFFSFPEGFAVRFTELDEPLRVVLMLDFDAKLVGIPRQVRLHTEAVVGLFLRSSPTEEALP